MSVAGQRQPQGKQGGLYQQFRIDDVMMDGALGTDGLPRCSIAGKSNPAATSPGVVSSGNAFKGIASLPRRTLR